MEFNENFTGLISSGTYEHIEVFTTEKVERGKNRICLNRTVLKNRIQTYDLWLAMESPLILNIIPYALDKTDFLNRTTDKK